LRPPGSDVSRPPPLTGRVILDHSSPWLGSNHVKLVVAHIGGRLTAFIGGIDLVDNRCDATPHDRLTLHGRRWGWHDAVTRLRGPAAARAWDVFGTRWEEAVSLPRKRYLRRPFQLEPLNPVPAVAPPGPAPGSGGIDRPGVAVRVLRSEHHRKVDSVFPWRRVARAGVPPKGIHEVFDTMTAAIAAARRYVYMEDQYLAEYAGGKPEFELYPHLRGAAERGVKIILVGSGTRDPEDPGLNPGPINHKLNRDLRRKIIDRLDDTDRDNVAVYRIEHVTVHAKLLLVDDVFACIGSANMFSRSMAGVDSEVSTAVETTTGLVRELRVEVWADHLRTPVTPQLRPRLEDLDVALGIWRPSWSTAPEPQAWRTPDNPSGFCPRERVLRLVGS
jgi:phosphatidylserine/phosphatidylglycerophosphate/cardiolipin synthase-like enzyme